MDTEITRLQKIKYRSFPLPLFFWNHLSKTGHFSLLGFLIELNKKTIRSELSTLIPLSPKQLPLPFSFIAPHWCPPLLLCEWVTVLIYSVSVHGVAQSRTRLKRPSMHALEKEMATRSSVPAWRIPGTGEPGGLPSVGSHSWTQLKRLSSSSIPPRLNTESWDHVYFVYDDVLEPRIITTGKYSLCTCWMAKWMNEWMNVI